jgi:hypothetical protein
MNKSSPPDTELSGPRLQYNARPDIRVDSSVDGYLHVVGYTFISEKLKNYTKYQNTVNGHKGSCFRPIKSCLPGCGSGKMS